VSADPWDDLLRKQRVSAATYRRRRLVLVLIVSAIVLLGVMIQEGAVDRSEVDTPSVSRDPLSQPCPTGDIDGC
jgi:hypothetical protein